MGALVWDWALDSCWATHCHGQGWVMDMAMVITITREVEVGHTTPLGENTYEIIFQEFFPSQKLSLLKPIQK